MFTLRSLTLPELELKICMCIVKRRRRHHLDMFSSGALSRVPRAPRPFLSKQDCGVTWRGFLERNAIPSRHQRAAHGFFILSVCPGLNNYASYSSLILNYIIVICNGWHEMVVVLRAGWLEAACISETQEFEWVHHCNNIAGSLHCKIIQSSKISTILTE